MNGINLSTATDIRLGGTSVSAVYFGSTKLWPSGHDYSQDYLTIISSSDNNTIGWKTSNNYDKKTINISIDNGTTWTQKTSDTTGVTLATLNNGDKMLVKGSNTTYSTSSVRYNYFISTDKFDVEGNIMSMIYGDNFINQTIFSSTYVFYQLFYNCSNLINAENLILPATNLTQYCYSNMFSGCTSLVTAPELPATTLADLCYSLMFLNCSSLTTAPELPATTLAINCYHGMFRGCKALTTAPELPATTLVTRCYFYMFYNCFSLNYIKCLATDISATSCTDQWLYHVATSGTFVKDASMSSWTTGAKGIPSGWTVQDAT